MRRLVPLTNHMRAPVTTNIVKSCSDTHGDLVQGGHAESGDASLFSADTPAEATAAPPPAPAGHEPAVACHPHKPGMCRCWETQFLAVRKAAASLRRSNRESSRSYCPVRGSEPSILRYFTTIPAEILHLQQALLETYHFNE